MEKTTRTKKPTQAQRIAELERKLEETSQKLALEKQEGAELRAVIERRNETDRIEFAKHKATAQKLRKLMSAAKRIEEHTRDWGEHWPRPELAMIRKLTYGDVKALVDACRESL